MVKFKRNLLPILSIVSLVGIFAMGVVFKLSYGADVYTPLEYVIRYITRILVALVPFIIVSAFIKDHHIYGFAHYCSIAVFLLCFLCEIGYGWYDFYEIGSYVLMVTALFPFALFSTAKSLNNNTEEKKIYNYILDFVPTVVMLIFCLTLDRPWTAMIMFAVVAAYVIRLKANKRLNIHWAAIAAVAVAVAGIFTYGIFDRPYVLERVATIITRGQNDPLGAGYVRVCIDEILKNSSLFAGFNDNGQMQEAGKFILGNGDFAIVTLIGKYGWIAFICLALLFTVFLVSVVAMARKTNQSEFASDIAFICAAALVFATLHNLVNLFLLDGSGNVTPFLYGNTFDQMYIILFGIILALYFRRYEYSEIYSDEKKEHLNIFRMIKDFLERDDEEDIDYDSDDDFEDEFRSAACDDSFFDGAPSDELFYLSSLSKSVLPWEILRIIRIDEMMYYLFVNSATEKYGIMKKIRGKSKDVFYRFIVSDELKAFMDHLPDDLSDEEKAGIEDFARSVYIDDLYTSASDFSDVEEETTDSEETEEADVKI